jgi:hypothetical protein
MDHAAFVQVEVDPASDSRHRHSVLHQSILPELRELPGFKAAMWLNNRQGVGTCIAQFATEEQAVASLQILSPSNGPRVLHSGTCVVELESRVSPPLDLPFPAEPPADMPLPTLPPES